MPEDADSYAICLRDAYLHYGSGKKKVPVLIGLDMTIPRGAIYGLLGPSGCGKTTLLSCIVGKQASNLVDHGCAQGGVRLCELAILLKDLRPFKSL